MERLGKVCRAKLDDSDKESGMENFSEQEMRGIPLRVELRDGCAEGGEGVITGARN